ncbi:MAG: S8 family peptidase, partial [Natronosporangium sp.]
MLVRPGSGGVPPSATVQAAPRDGQAASFETIQDGEQLYVLPSDAWPLVPEVLDRELFNVTKLAQLGELDGTPVIATGDPAGAGAGVASEPGGGPAGLTVTAELPSIDAVAGTVAPDGSWWRSFGSGAGLARSSDAGKVWLDEPVQVSLDESVPLVGAPAAWAAGYDGTGLTVAVLDTGIDADHPDLAGKVVAAENFSELSDTPDDRFGHGTHVAGIVAGTGAASGGTYRGVAPGAELMNGKVLGDGGSGFASDIIDGMEWAAAGGADVINMSLGGEATDGTDPLSQAVNSLTAQHDVLFVIAAGNRGFLGDGSVGAPGAADAALTVGSVDKSEQLAFDSSRGPRIGDWAIKPDLTAPGVGIAAARAAGTALGPIVAEHYTRISGTSMATPHVAGAAAILLQQDPDLGAGQLKAALATTAVPNDGLEIYQQGGGRLDLAAAVSTPVLASPSPLDLGYLRHPQAEADPVTAEVSYTNRSDAPVTLDLSVAARSREGQAPAPDQLTVSPASLTVEPGGQATATVTLDPRQVPNGLYSGYLVAGRDGVPVSRVPVGFYHEPESYDLTVVGTARDGRPAAGISIFDVLDVDDMADFQATSIGFGPDGTTTVRVPGPATYSVMGIVYTYDGPTQFTQERVLVGDPEVEVTGDTTVRLDARPAVPVTVDTPAHDSAPIGVTTLAVYRASEQGRSHVHSYTSPPQPQFAVPTGSTGPVTKGAFEFYSFWQLGEPELALRVVEPEQRELAPSLMSGSPPMDGDEVHRLVYAGFGNPADYQGLDAAGAVVLTRRGGPNHAAKEAAARAAGAAALVVANNVSGNYVGFVGGGAAEIPTMTISMEEGDALLSLLDGGEVIVRLLGNPVTDYRYDLVLPEPDVIPADLSYLVEASDLATVENRFHSDVPDHEMNEVRQYWRPYESFAVGFTLHVPVPFERTEYVVAADTRYRQEVYAEVPFTGSQLEVVTFYQPGEVREQSWWRQVVRPDVIERNPAQRELDTFSLRLAEWADAQPGHWGERHNAVDTTAFRFYQDGELVAEQPRPWGSFPMSPDSAQYRLELDLTRDAPWWSTSTATRTAWSFSSQRPAAGPELVPLLLVDYQLPLDQLNTALDLADRRGPPMLDLRVEHQPGVAGAAVAGARLWISYDDGQSWLARPVRRSGDGQFQGVLPVRAPAGAEFVSTRVEAWDADGNRVEQE